MVSGDVSVRALPPLFEFHENYFINYVLKFIWGTNSSRDFESSYKDFYAQNIAWLYNGNGLELNFPTEKNLTK